MPLVNGTHRLGSQRWTVVATVEDGELASVQYFKDEDEFRKHIGEKIDDPFVWGLVEQMLDAGLTMQPYGWKPK